MELDALRASWVATAGYTRYWQRGGEIELANLVAFGDEGVDKDFVKAVELYRKAAKKRYSGAGRILIQSLDEGRRCVCANAGWWSSWDWCRARGGRRAGLVQEEESRCQRFDAQLGYSSASPFMFHMWSRSTFWSMRWFSGFSMGSRCSLHNMAWS